MSPSRRAASRTTYALLAFALGAVAPRASLAADAPSDEAAVEQRREEAKAKYQAGVDAYERKRFKDAVDLFLAADRLAPSAPLSFNIARAYEKLGDDSSALRWYRDYLRRDSTAQNADAVRELVAKLAQALVKKGVQQLTVLSAPAGATVSVDDQPVGVTPWTGDLVPGKHRLLLSYRGYTDAARELELAAAEPLDVSLRLEQQAAPAAAPVLPVTTPQAPPPVTPAPASNATSTPASGKSLGIWPWVTLGAGAATLGGALAFELMRRSAEDEAENEPTQLGFQSAFDKEESRKTTARVLLGVGGAVVIAGGVMLLVDSGSHQPSPRLGFACLPGSCALSAEGRF